MTYSVAPITIPDTLVLEAMVFSGVQGFFFESFSARCFTETPDLGAEFQGKQLQVHTRSAVRSGILESASAGMGVPSGVGRGV